MFSNSCLQNQLAMFEFSTAPIILDHGPERVLVIKPGLSFLKSRKLLHYAKKPLQSLSWNAMLKVFSKQFWTAMALMIVLMILVLSWFGKKFNVKSIIFAKMSIIKALLGQSFDEKGFLKVRWCSCNFLNLNSKF